MRFLPRLFPSLILAASLMLALRLGAIYHDAGRAFAEGEASPQKPAATEPTPPADAPDGARPKAPPPAHFSPAEIEVLQELAKRREALDQRQADQDRRELTLKAVEQRVDEKIAQLKQIQSQVDAAIGKSAAEDDERIKSLVHIYENMKPKDAATIFEGMEMPSLLQLLTRMKDLKTAPILAAMAPDKARAVTVALAQRKDPADQKTN